MTTSRSYSAALPDGTILDHYRIESLLGEGGFGITYLAVDTDTGQQVAIKENFPKSCAVRKADGCRVRVINSQEHYDFAMAAFIDEAQLLSRFEHEGIVKIHEAFQENETAYFVMSYVGPLSLETTDAQRKESQRWSEPEIITLLQHLLAALEYLHSQGVIHRDIKPSNIVLTVQGKPVLIDFGTARELIHKHTNTVIDSGGYTPIEQKSKMSNYIGAWSDLYALGCTMYRLMTGKEPACSTDRIFIKNDPVIPLEQREDMNHYSRELRSSIDQAMQVDFKERWQSAAEWGAYLRTIKSEEERLRELLAESEIQRAAVEHRYSQCAAVVVSLKKDRDDRETHIDKLQRENSRIIEEVGHLRGELVKFKALLDVMKQENSQSIAEAERLHVQLSESERCCSALKDPRRKLSMFIIWAIILVSAYLILQRHNKRTEAETALENVMNQLSSEQEKHKVTKQQLAEKTAGLDKHKVVAPPQVASPLPQKQWSYPQDVSTSWIARHGDYIALRSSDEKMITLYGLSTGEKIASFDHGNWVNHVAFSVDGRYLATAGYDKSVKVYDIADKKLIVSIEHGGSVDYVVFSANGHFLAAASRDRNVKLYDIEQKKVIASIEHGNWVNHVTFSADGRYLATASLDKSAKLYDIEERKQIACIVHGEAVWYTTFSADGRYLATASDDKSAKIYDIAQKKQIALISHGDWVRCASFSPDGRYLATASWDNTVKVYDIGANKQIAYIVHRSSVIHVVFSGDNRYLATRAADNTVKLYDMLDLRLVDTIYHDSNVCDVFFTADGKQLLRATEKELLATPLD